MLSKGWGGGTGGREGGCLFNNTFRWLGESKVPFFFLFSFWTVRVLVARSVLVQG